MSVVGNLSRHDNLAELAEPREIPTYQSVATRQAEARSNLGIAASLAELTVLDGAVAGTAVAGKAMVTDANNGIAAFRDARQTQLKRMVNAGQAFNTTGTLAASVLFANGIVTSTTAAAVVATLPTGTSMDAVMLVEYPTRASSDAFDFTVINTGPNTFTLATNTGWTDGGNAFTAIAAGTSAIFRCRITAANTFTIFRVA